MPVILAGRAWTARHIRNNCLRQHCHAAARNFRREDIILLKPLCARTLTVLETRSRVLLDLHPKELPVVHAVIHLCAYADQWLRHPEDWQPDAAQDARGQWAHLLRHLLARYPVPEFLDSVWLIWGGLEHFERNCWCALGFGRSLRKTAGFPVSVSSRVLHAALAAGEGGSLSEAIWHAQLQCLGVPPVLREAVLGSRVPKELGHHGLWARLVAKFAAGPDATAASFALVEDMLVAVEAHHGAAQVEQLLHLPLAALIRHAVKFVRRLMQTNGHVLTEEQVRLMAEKKELSRIAATCWKPMLGSEWFESRCGHAHGKATWRVEELCTVAALKAEGQAMRHCVAGYVRRCRQGSSAIFSLRHLARGVEGSVHAQPVATIEVHPATRKIVQIRAQANRPVNNTVTRIVWEWALANHLN
ncbi:MAG TPA: PcfJ domain-containing protein [Prosthecobacter sp.]